MTLSADGLYGVKWYDDWMAKLGRGWKEVVAACCLRLCLEKVKKTTETLGRNSRSPGRDSNRVPLECESGLLHTAIPFHSVLVLIFICWIT
jgi:hypothetical protein